MHSPAPVGVFDPDRMSLYIDSAIDFSDLGTALKSNPTLFHEVVHSYQHFCTSSGVVTGCIRPVKSALLFNMLDRHDRPLHKPLLPRSVYERTSQSGGRYTFTDIDTTQVRSSKSLTARLMVHQYFFDFEALHNVLDSPENDKIAARRNSYYIPRDGYMPTKGWERSLTHLFAMIFQEFTTQLHPLTWPTAHDNDDFLKMVNSAVPYMTEPRSLKVGMSLLQEGQARLMELQLVGAVDAKRREIDSFVTSGHLTYIYMKAFDLFIELTDVGRPSSLLDWRVHLFMVVCDLALNPMVGYLHPIEEVQNLFEVFSPGDRFINLCRLIASCSVFKQLGVKYGVTFTFSHDFMNDASRELRVLSREDKEDNAAHRFGALVSQCDHIDFNESLPFCVLFVKHIHAMAAKAAGSGAYFSPLASVLREGPPVELFFPPTVTASTGFSFFGVRPRSAWGADINVMTGFYMEQVYSEICHQIVRNSGPFDLSCEWVPEPMRQIAIAGGRALFERDIGQPLDDVLIEKE